MASDSCPTCGQVLPNLKEISDKRDELSSAVALLQEELKEAIEARKNITHITNALEKEQEEIKEELEEEKKKLHQIQILKSRRITLGKVVIDADILVHTERVQKIKSSINPHLRTADDIKDRIQLHERKEVTLKKGQEDLQKDLDALWVWEGAFSKDIRTLLFNKICLFLNNRTRHHLDKLNSSHFKVEFSTNKAMKSGKTKEEFSLKAWNEVGGESFAALSGGEKQIISFAVGLALADLAETQTQHTSNILILDEPFLYLDSKNYESVVNYLLDDLMQRKSTIFLISHEDDLKALVPNRIHVTKEKGISTASGKGVMVNDG